MTGAAPAAPRRSEGTTCTGTPEGEEQACGGELELVQQRTVETVLYSREQLTTRIDVHADVRCRRCGRAETRVLERGRVPTDADDFRSW